MYDRNPGPDFTSCIPRLEYDVIVAIRKTGPSTGPNDDDQASIENLANNCEQDCFYYKRAFHLRKWTQDNNQLLLSQLLQLTQVHQHMEQSRQEVIQCNPVILCSQ